MDEIKLVLSQEEKEQYVFQIISRAYKILHLFEEKDTSGFSPKEFIASQIFELKAADSLFNGKLIKIIVKLKAIYDNYDHITLREIKKQVFEVQKIANSLLKE